MHKDIPTTSANEYAQSQLPKRVAKSTISNFSLNLSLPRIYPTTPLPRFHFYLSR